MERLELLGLDDFAPVVVTAVTADCMRPFRLVTLRALNQLGALYGQVSATFTLAGMSVSSLGQGHGRPII